MKSVIHKFQVIIAFIFILALPCIAFAKTSGTPVNCQDYQFAFGQELVLVSASQLLFRSTTSGWQALPTAPHWDQIKVANDQLVYLYDDTMNKLYSLNTNNQNWATVATTPFTEQDKEELFPSPNANVLFLTVRSTDQQRRGIYKSSDGGLHWQKTFTNTDFFSTLSPMIFSPTFIQDGTAFVAELGRRTFVGVWQSTDFGENWVKSTNGMTVSVQYDPRTFLAISPQFVQDRTIFSGGGDRGFGYYKSTNAGESWMYTAALHPSAFALSPDYQSDQTILIASLSDGIYLSTDGGSTQQVLWDQVGPRLVGIRHILPAGTIPAALSTTKRQALLTATGQLTQTLEMWAVVATSQIDTCYLYRSTDRGVTWQQQTLFETPYSTYFPFVAQEPTE